jgi:hypothetical protein
VALIWTLPGDWHSLAVAVAVHIGCVEAGAAAAAVGAATIATAAAPAASRDAEVISLIRIVDPLFMVEPLLGSHPGLPTMESVSSMLVPNHDSRCQE